MRDPKPSRRDVLAGLAAAATAAATTTGCARTAARKPRVGLQLYTVREAIELDFEGTVRRIAEIGFAGVEYYPLPEAVTPARAAAAFAAAGLEVLGMHTPLPVGDQLDVALRLADAFRCDRVIDPGWPQGERYASREAIARTAELLDRTAAGLAARGLRLGLHNHWWELERTDGVLPFYELLRLLDEAVFFEIDTYWARTAGQDPAAVVRDFGARAPLLHVKDGPAVKGEAMYRQVPAGEGSLDFRAIAAAGRGAVEWLVVEFDEFAGDIFAGAGRSLAYLTGQGLGVGRG